MNNKLLYEATRDQLSRAIIPAQTRTYKPISHESLMDLTMESIYQAGFNVKSEHYSSAKDGMVATGRYLIDDVGDSEMKLAVNWQNSYDKSLPVVFSMGALVLVCTNGMMATRDVYSFRKKHVGEIQSYTPLKIPEYIKGGGDMFAGLQNEREALKQIEISKRTTSEIIGRMFLEEDFIESTQLNIIKRELKNPTHDYKSPGSLWELFQHTTFAIGGIHPSHWMQDHLDAHRFFTGIAEAMTEDASYELLVSDPYSVTEEVENAFI